MEWMIVSFLLCDGEVFFPSISYHGQWKNMSLDDYDRRLYLIIDESISKKKT